MNLKHSRTLTLFWAPGESIDLHTLANALQDLPPGAQAHLIETAPTNADDTTFNTMRIEYTIDEAAEQRRIIKEHESLDPMKAFADLTRTTRNLPTRN